MAPYYLALPRPTKQGRSGRQSSGRDSYVRSAPSSIYTVVTGVANGLPFFIMSAILAFLCPLAAAVLHNKGPVYTVLRQSFVGCEVPVPQPLTFAFAHPQVTLGFLATIPDALADLLDSWGAVWKVIPKKGKICLIDVDQSRIGELMAYETYLNFDVSPLGGSMRLQDHVQFQLLVRTLTTVASALQLAYCTGGDVAAAPDYAPSAWNIVPPGKEDRPDPADKAKKITYNIPEKIAFTTQRYLSRNVQVSDTDYWEFGSNMIDHKTGPQFFAGIATETIVYMNPRGAKCVENITWDRSNPPATMDYGIFLPYEPNYTLPDRQGFTAFANDFSGFLTNEDGSLRQIPTLQDSWTEAIHRTPVGEQLGHLMATLSLARKVHGAVKVIITNGIYEGAVIHSARHFVLSQKGVEVESVDQAQLIKDIQEFNTHSRILGEFIKHFTLGPSIAPEDIKSMRELKNLIFAARAGVLNAADLSFIDLNALYLNFPQRPATFNVETLQALLSYLDASAPAAIPVETYMPYQGLTFANDDNSRLALCMFGMIAPSPLGNGQEHLLCRRGPLAKDPSPIPLTLKFAKKPLQACVTDWIGCARSSTMTFDPRTKGKRTFQLKGDLAASGWTAMAAWAQRAYSLEKIEVGAAATASKKRPREDDGNDGQGAPPPKVARLTGQTTGRATFF